MSQRVGLSLAVVLSGAVLTACPPESPPPPAEPNFAEIIEGIKGCDDATVAQNPDSRCFTYRAVGGVSMGGGSSGRIGFRNPQLWDVVAVMGSPFADTEFLFRMMRENHMSGFCSLEQLEQAVADGKDLDDPNDPSIFCGVHDVFPLQGGDQVDPGLFPAVDGSSCSMFRSDFNHWYRGPNAGRGGSFSRNSLLEIMHDLVASFGNPFYENPASAYFPPGVPDTWHVSPQTDNAAVREALCAAPIVLEGANAVFNREYNPDGSYPVVTFCDGNDMPGDDLAAGNYFPDQRKRFPVEFLLAVDINRNGRRDYGEPIIINDQERFRDCGSDGLCNGEPGDTEDDDWDPIHNVTGTENNGVLDEGESFDDDGLDGVPGTGDFGEGNGVWDRSPALAGLVDDSPSGLFKSVSAQQAARLDVWIDAGIRDFLNTAQMSNSLFAQLQTKIPNATSYNGFDALPVDPSFPLSTENYIYFMSDYSRRAMGQVAYLRYGKSEICPSTDDDLGDGNHVGAGDVVSRVFTLFSFLSARMPAQGRDVGYGGDLASMAPSGRLNDFAFLTNYQSQALGRSIDYGVLLPPDYFLESQKDATYPVLYFFHGQGMEPNGMVPLGLALLGPMKESARADRLIDNKTDLQRAIIIWADGTCVGDTCYTGNFYADFKGLPRPDRRYEAAFYELIRHVESTYRTKTPELIPLSELE